MKRNLNAVDPLLRADSQSTTPHAIAIRIHRLHHPEAFEAMNLAKKLKKRVEVGRELVKHTTQRGDLIRKVTTRLNGNSPLATRVRFHLSKGRDASDIAIRENILVSTAQELVKLVKGEAL